MLDARLTPEEVKARLLSPRFRNRQFSGLLLDQSFLAGLGNYLRVEILWQVGLTGQHKAKDLNEAQLNALSHALLDIPRLSYTTRGQADENKHHGALFRFKLFHRDGEACERCGGIIEKDNTVLTPVLLVPALPEIAGTDIGERLLPDGATLISPTKVVWAHRLI